MDQNDERPWVILNAGMTIGGKISSSKGDTALSNEEDWKRVHHLRNSVDAILVGKGTVLADDSKLTVNKKYFAPNVIVKHPIGVVPASKGDIPLNARVLTYRKDIVTIIAVSEEASQEQIAALKSAGAELIITGKSQVDLKQLFDILREQYGVKKLLIEGGSTINWSCLELQLIDEIRLFVASKIVGGVLSPSLFGGKGFHDVTKSPHLELTKLERVGDGFLVTYKVDYL